MKKIVALALAMMMCSCFVSCGSKVAPWGEDDFMLYGENGKIIERLSESNGYNLFAMSAEDGSTYRDVAVGDDAIQALKKYDLCYDKAIYGAVEADMPERLTKDVDLEKTITSGDEIMLMFTFDENYKAVDAMALVESNTQPYFMFGFGIKDGKISLISIGQGKQQ